MFPLVDDTAYISSLTGAMKKLSSLGTAMFVSAIVAGGMTSTPAAGALMSKGVRFNLSMYAITYIGALITAIVDIKLLF